MAADSSHELTQLSPPDSSMAAAKSTTKDGDDGRRTPTPSNVEEEEEEEEEKCQTPRTKESRLPSTPKSCPPAPRKPRRVVRCKRKLMRDVEFIMVGVEELENLFQRRDVKKRKLRD